MMHRQAQLSRRYPLGAEDVSSGELSSSGLGEKGWVDRG